MRGSVPVLAVTTVRTGINRHRVIVSPLELPGHDSSLDDRAAGLIGLDKKRRGNSVKFVLVRAAGQIEFKSLELSLLQRLASDLSRSS